jgi:hypothetical protein
VLLMPDAPGARARRIAEMVLILGAMLLVGFALDRLYHFHRFGTWHGTYAHLAGEQWRARDPSLPAGFPFHHPFLDGFLGPFVSIRKAVWLFDPMLIVAALATAGAWRRMSSPARWLIVVLVINLLLVAAGYARYFLWHGDSAWGDRFTTVPVHLIALVGAAILSQHWQAIAPLLRRAAVGLLPVALLAQLLSLVFTFNLELVQETQWQRELFIVGQRVVNIVAVASGNFEAWGLSGPGFLQDPKATTPPFLVFAFRSTLSPAAWAAMLGAWLIACAAALAWAAILAKRISPTREPAVEPV